MFPRVTVICASSDPNSDLGMLICTTCAVLHIWEYENIKWCVFILKCSIKQYNCNDSECTEFTLHVMVSENAPVSV